MPGAEGSYVKIRDALKVAAPKDAPKPGAFKMPGAQAQAPQAAESPAAETSTGGEEQ